MDRAEQKWIGVMSAAGAQAFLASRRLRELPEEVFQLGAVWSACERCVAECDAAGADGLYRVLTGFAGGADQRVGGAFWRGAAAHYLGILASLLSRWDAAAAHFEEALRTGAAGIPRACDGRGAKRHFTDPCRGSGLGTRQKRWHSEATGTTPGSWLPLTTTCLRVPSPEPRCLSPTC